MSKLPLRPGNLARRRSPGAPGPAVPEEAPAVTVIGSLRPQSHVAVHGMIRSVGTVVLATGTAYHFTLVDGSGEVDVLFTGPCDSAGLQPSTRIIAEGMVGSYDSKLALWNPRYEIVPAG
jgi:hypothetical protein